MTESTDSPPPDDSRWDLALLDAGFRVDPDADLTGRAADETAAVTSATELDRDDPWADVGVPAVGLTDDQRSYVVTSSPALGAALPEQSPSGDDPFGDVPPEALGAADDEIIDLD